MLSVIDYTRKLLYEQDCVVLPELGGFLTHFNHAFYSEQHNLFHAPRKRVAFNEALKLDDGLLTHYISLNEQVSREEAHKYVRQFVETIKQTIRESQSFFFEGIGTLSANEEGKLRFEPLVNLNYHNDSFGFKSVTATLVTPTVQITESESAAEWTATDRPAEELENAPLRRRRSRAFWYVGGAVIISAIVAGSLTSLPSDSLKSSLNPFDLFATSTSFFTEDKKTNDVKKSEKLTVNQSIELISTPSVPKIEKTATEPIAVVVKALPLKKKESVNAELTIVKPVERFKISDEGAAYFVIAGAFSKIDNAQKLENKLKQKGYEKSFIVNPNAADGELIKVAAVGFESWNKAKIQLKYITNLSGSRAWIWHDETK